MVHRAPTISAMTGPEHPLHPPHRAGAGAVTPAFAKRADSKDFFCAYVHAVVVSPHYG
jgi:hypothetical protein